jgi:hypothetical protein
MVGYQMKGAQTIAIERKNIKDLVMRMEDNNGDITGFFYAARKLLNRASVERTIEYLRLLTINLGKKSSASGTRNM